MARIIQVAIEKENLFAYLSEKFRVHISLPKELFEDGVQENMSAFGLQTAFPAKSPPGNVHFRMAKGKANDRDALIWETVVHSEGKDIPEGPEAFSRWLEAAHVLAEEWFFKLVEGQLLKQFE